MNQPLIQAALAAASVLGVAVLVAGLRTLLGKRLTSGVRQLLCPICLGVVLTWVSLLVLRALGTAIDPTLLGVLLGASAVGLVSQLEKTWSTRRGYLAWKTLAVTAGLGAAYGASTENWLVLLASAIAWAVVTAVFATTTMRTSKRAASIEKRMENCC